MSAPRKRLAELSVDEFLEQGLAVAEAEAEPEAEAAEERQGCVAAPEEEARDAPSSSGRKRRKSVQAAALAEAEAAESRAFALFAAPRRPKASRPPTRGQEEEEGARAEEPNERLILVSDPSGLVPLSEDAPFKSLGLNDWLAGNCAALGLRRPTPVQHACVPVVLAGRDVIGIAQTGSGKTAAFALPCLQRLSCDPYGVYALVLTPTRELALQIGEQFLALAAGFALRVCVSIGGEDFSRQAASLTRRPHVVVATPGRLREQMEAHEGARAAFGRVAMLVLDEADRLLEPSFEPELAVVLASLPPRRQTLLFSATLTPAVCALQRLTGGATFRFAAQEGLSLPQGLRQQMLLTPAKVKEVYLAHVLGEQQLRASRVRSVLLFASTVRSCQLLADMMRMLGCKPAVLHSAMPQRARAAALHRFRAGAASLLVATDVAARGLDIPTVDLVINADVPATPADYIHRCGRTARAGRGGVALTLVTQYDVQRVSNIEQHTGTQMEPLPLEEAEVLKGLTSVMAARRQAALHLAEPGGFDEKLTELRRNRQAGALRRAAGIAAAAEAAA